MGKWIKRLILLLGFLLISYPLVESFRQELFQSRAIQTIESSVEELSDDEKEALIGEAITYNQLLYAAQQGLASENGTAPADFNYHALLSVDYDTKSEEGEQHTTMGSLKIPKIDVDLPIYHGTGDEVLQMGVGHQEGSSLPIGEEQKHVVLTGHRGLAGAKLFTRLDEMVEGDLFFITVMGETQAYEVYDIVIKDPEDAAMYVMLIGDEDIASLVTCTPYGINTQRLVITGRRVPYEEKTMTKIQPKIPSIRELLFSALPFIVVILILIRFLVKKYQVKHQCYNCNYFEKGEET